MWKFYFSILSPWNFSVYSTRYHWPAQIFKTPTSIFRKYASPQELTLLFLSYCSFRSLAFSRLFRFHSFRWPSRFLPKKLLSSCFFYALRPRSRAVSVMNHNFKLKSGEISVTNDAEPLNYALKSAREESDESSRRKGRATFHHVARRDSAILVIRHQTTRCLRA